MKSNIHEGAVAGQRPETWASQTGGRGPGIHVQYPDPANHYKQAQRMTRGASNWVGRQKGNNDREPAIILAQAQVARDSWGNGAGCVYWYRRRTAVPGAPIRAPSSYGTGRGAAGPVSHPGGVGPV